MNDGSKYWVYRHWRADLVLVYNILYGRVNLPIDEFFETPANPNLRGPRFNLRHRLPHLTCHKFTFPFRIVETWNKFSIVVVDAASKEIFKFRLDGVWDTLLVP